MIPLHLIDKPGTAFTMTAEEMNTFGDVVLHALRREFLRRTTADPTDPSVTSIIEDRANIAALRVIRDRFERAMPTLLGGATFVTRLEVKP